MHRKLTISLSDALLTGYREMAADEEAERKALEWSEALIGDIADETWCNPVGSV
ncbi:MAG: hypothetical protein HQK60_06160 [Deltaproteobacteria bacterium]|nr:hypothetical protein [Deltaproteobacteria bacterium]